MPALDELIDRVYEAAAVPELWPNVLGRMSAAAEGDGGLLFTADPKQFRWTTSADIHERMTEFVRDGWALKNPRPLRMGSRNHAGFLRDSDCFTAEEMDRDPVYVEFFRKRGLGWNAGTLVAVPSGDSIIFSFERAYDKGPVHESVVEMLDLFRPHLARAALWSARLGLERARAMAEALEALGLPGAVLREQGKLYAANPLFECLIPSLLVDRRDRLHLCDQDADRLLAMTFTNAALTGHTSAVNSIPVAASEGFPPYILHLLPVRGSAHDIFSQATFLLVVTPVDRAAVPSAEVLQGLFDLTPAEARLARLVGHARSPRDAARRLGITEGTARTALKRVLAKTGMRRQAELVSLLGGKALGAEQID